MFYKPRSPKVGHVALLRPSIAPKPDPVSPSLITNELTHLLPAWLFVSVAADDSISVSQTCSVRRKDLFAALKHRLFSTFFVDCSQQKKGSVAGSVDKPSGWADVFHLCYIMLEPGGGGTS